MRTFLLFALTLLAAPAGAHVDAPLRVATQTELHQRLVPSPAADAGVASGSAAAKTVALTLDACGGGFDRPLMEFLVARRIPATIFVTSKWMARNPDGILLLKAHPDLFEIEDHGADHVPAVIGANARVYGIRGAPDVAHLRAEVLGGAGAIERAFGSAPRWYRGATAVYDPLGLATIDSLGLKVAGFSVNADAGATLAKSAIIGRLAAVRDSDVIIAHMNKPNSDSAEGLAVGLDRLLARGFRFTRLGDRALARTA